MFKVEGRGSKLGACGKRLGLTLIEMLVALAIFGISIFALVSLWQFSFNTTDRTDENVISYNLGRRVVERYKALGFRYAPEGTITWYYDNNGENESNSASSTTRYRVTGTVTSDKFETNLQTGETRPAPDSMRSVVIEVRHHPSNRLIMSSGANLVRSGV